MNHQQSTTESLNFLKTQQYQAYFQFASAMSEDQKQECSLFLLNNLPNQDLDILLDLALSVLTYEFDFLSDINYLQACLYANFMDAKYALLIFQSKVHEITEKEKLFKYLSVMGMFSEVVSENEKLKEDFLQIHEKLTKSFDQCLTSTDNIGVEEEQLTKQRNSIKNIYFKHAYSMLSFGKRNLNFFEKLFTPKIIYSLPLNIKSQINNLHCSCSQKQLQDKAPIITLYYLLNYYETYKTIYSQKILAILSAKCIEKYFPQQIKLTLQNSVTILIAESLIKIFFLYFRKIEITSLKMFFQIQKNFLTVDLIEVFQRMTVFIGFLDPKSQIYAITEKLINGEILSPMCKTKVWEYCWQKSQLCSEINYKVFCLSNLRKLIVTFNKTKFEAFLRGQIGIKCYKVIQHQLQICIDHENMNYIGHVINLASNWLMLKKDGFRVKLVDEDEWKNKLQLKVQKIQKSIEQKMKEEKEEKKYTQLELVLFQLSQLSFA